MKTLRNIAFIAALAGMTTAASAADLFGSRDYSIKDAPPPPVLTWSGF